MIRRRVLNEAIIQPTPQDADAPLHLRGNQLSIHHYKTARLAVVAEAVLSALIVIVPLSVHAGIFDELFATASSSTPHAATITLNGPSDVPLLVAIQNPDPQGGKGGADLIVDENALVSTGPIGEDEKSAKKQNAGEISVYTVREGDSLSEIADMFDVTANTILWANDLTKTNGIQPGQSLVILPVAGVRHVVKSGDTINSIAKKYGGDSEEILSYNQLASAQDLVVGDTLIIPGGMIKAAAPKKTTRGESSSSGGGFIHPAPGAKKSQGIHGYNGVDLAGSMGSAVRAAAGGEVIVAKGSGWNGGYGNYVVVKHGNGTQTLYAHLSSLSVGVGEYVEQGQTIGGMGNSGRSTGVHLHFEVRGGRNPF